ncbi:ATP-binding protein [Altererythrobacter arenosus]|uniref:histidine kinase n=1 Tax=Altererythrobacter arenosus TaxID=3032592 RepID=A0ABY8FU76_9SPHN|nr:ATP-binding protein [Altererythrobacter sp. CAU 1644]WFL77800.1 ATP-binding protein [Altererythrobacter sp. CAU 1644]
MNKRILLSAAIDSAIFAATVGGTYLAQQADRPITAVLVFLSGVILVAFRSGLVSGVIAAIAASLIYNFFLSEPTFQFGITSADEAVPLLAFNVAAIAAAAMVGRLKDSAERAYIAQSETAFLLTVSDRLQSAVKIEGVEKAIHNIVPRQGVSAVEIFLERGNVYYRPSTGEVEVDKLQPLLDYDDEALPWRPTKSIIVELPGARGPLGLVKFKLTEGGVEKVDQKNLQSVAAMLGLAVERCLLLDELTEARALARSEALKDALLSSVSHDLRTPVTVIQAAAGALTSKEVDLPPAGRERLLSSILQQCERLDRYTSELLDVGQIESGIQNDALEVVSPAEVLSAAIKHIRVTHPSVRFDQDVSRQEHYLRANPTMLEQALYNVIDNAQKFGGEAGPISVKLDYEENQAVISITDMGPGIFEHDRAKVFTRFFKGNATDSKSGLGLGLFIAKGFIEAFSGTIAVESPVAEGHGARFVVRLPLIAANENMVAA